MWTSMFFEKPYAECKFLVAWIKRQIDWNLFFCDKVYTECDFLPGTTKQSSSNYWDRNLFFAGSLRRNAIFLSCATKNSGPLKVDRNLFLREALSKTQDSGANTRLALIIFKGGNGNWIFLPWLAEARLSRDCFDNISASCSNIVLGPRGLMGYEAAIHICDILYVPTLGDSSTPYRTGIKLKNGHNFHHAPAHYILCII